VFYNARVSVVLRDLAYSRDVFNVSGVDLGSPVKGFSKKGVGLSLTGSLLTT